MFPTLDARNPIATLGGFLMLGGLALALGCGQPETRGSRAAHAVLHPTRGNSAHGTVRFETDPGGGVSVHTEVAGLPPGKHGIHVHQVGDCSTPDAKSAGPHFAFEKNPAPDRITGNLGELETAADGSARLEAVIAMAQLSGNRSIVGRSVVVHANGNDPTSPPDGNAGQRIACGVIEAR